MVTFDEFKAMGLALPQATERVTWGTSVTIRIGERMFALGAPESRSASVKATREDQAELVAAAPETFSVAPYVGRFGWVRIALDQVDPDELRDLLTDAWRRTAPRRLVREFDAAEPG
ncbi:MmcQ/YjbR family DNA-binding protein [Peterkaempfera bronchialis]|uniref:MmcQ/YjbR family DNA-binding protein n=1 Tax=Peterkaempfera bronchialis TaxID=2126346 RepID=A0A345SUN9_9ACTN|nr:MmcQ/YjbR family DNA-binding protein [Peterkaempfera bronchialis]AXI77444.1 MmcQ/YjbR family DNA-binding protein [Peterkaempfera bronchialis]